jgi:hypothetical protein
MSKELAAIFAAMGTQDFEEVIRALQNAAKIVSVYKRDSQRRKSCSLRVRTD